MPERLRLFEQEARAASAIDHPSIVAVHDVGREGDVPYVVLELVEGETLQRRLQRGRLPPRKALEIAIQIGHGLAAAHARGILHNDLKPANVILTRDGRVKILDFGLAGLRGSADAGLAAGTDDEGETLTQALFGTPGYIAPERIDGARARTRAPTCSRSAPCSTRCSPACPAFEGETPPRSLTRDDRAGPGRDRAAAAARARPDRAPRAREGPRPALPVGERPRVRARGALGRHRRAGRGRAPPGAPPLASPGLDVALGAGARRRRAVAAGSLWRLARCPPSSGSRSATAASRRRASRPTAGRSSTRRPGTARPALSSVHGPHRHARRERAAGAPTATSPPSRRPGELAVFPGRPYPALHEPLLAPGVTLSRVPMTGGAPRDVLPDVVAADWSPLASPDGLLRLAVVRDRDGVAAPRVPDRPRAVPRRRTACAHRASRRRRPDRGCRGRPRTASAIIVFDLEGEARGARPTGLTFTSAVRSPGRRTATRSGSAPRSSRTARATAAGGRRCGP